MVSNLSIVFMTISFLIQVLMPIVLVIYFYKKEKIRLRVVLIGASVFFVSQVLIRLPLLSFISTQEWYKSIASNVAVLAVFLGLTAGLFEEAGRFIAMKYFMKDNLKWKDGLAFGLGHGGIESILLVGMANLSNIVLSFMINAGVFDMMVKAKLPAEAVGQIKSILIGLAPITFLAGGYERIMAMIIQIAFSMLVLYSVKAKKPMCLLYAILLHGIVDSPLVILSSMKLNTWALELYVTLCATLGLALIIKLKGIFSKMDQRTELSI